MSNCFLYNKSIRNNFSHRNFFLLGSVVCLLNLNKK